MAIDTNQLVRDIDRACLAVAQQRRRDLLVMFYPSGSRITEWDIRDTYSELRTEATRESPIEKLDLLLHTNGGDPVAGYRISQAIRSLCKKLDVLVPEKAYSAGTLVSFAGDQILLGDYAGLSPIDITVYMETTRKERTFSWRQLIPFWSSQPGRGVKQKTCCADWGKTEPRHE